MTSNFMPKGLSVPFKTDVALSALCSMRVGGRAPLIAYPEDASSCASLLRAWDEQGVFYRVIGAMTNTLPQDAPLTYPLLCTRSMMSVTEQEDAVTVLSGVGVAALAHRYMMRGVDVAAALSTIPGTVGAAVRGNAGAFGHEMSDYVLSCEVYDPVARAVCVVPASEMAFSYRHSRLKHTREVILSVTLRARARSIDDMQMQAAEHRRRRREHQPTQPSLGSIFLRFDDGCSAAELIDRAGLKGMTVGGACVSERHAGFIVNRGGATAADVMALIDYIQQRLWTLYGRRAVCEICILPKEE